MAGTTTTSSLAGVLKGKMNERLAKAKTEPPKFDSGGSLPSGIENGIARLVSIKFQKIAEGKQDAGKLIMVASGIIVSPDTHAGVTIKGRRTSVIEQLFDTPNKSRKTLDDHIEWIMNLFKCLGADLSDMTEVTQLDTVYGPALVKAAPHFSFRTWSGKATAEYPNPRTNETWGQMVAYEAGPDNTDSEASSGVVDDTKIDHDPVNEPADENVDQGDGGEIDLDALAEAAADDESAQAQLIDIAVSKGVKKKDAEEAESWAAVVEMIRTKENGDIATPGPEEFEPAKGEVYKYHTIDPKTKKPAINPKTKKPILVECEVKVVDKKTKTVVLSDLNTKAEYKGVKWDALIQ